MATKSEFSLKGKGRDSYLELILAFPLSSIRSAEHLAAALKVMDCLLAREGVMTARRLISKLAEYFKVDVSVLAGNL